MNTPLKITAFAVALAATFGAAYGVGDVITPIGTSAEPAAHAEHGGSDVPNKEDAPEGEHGGHADTQGRATTHSSGATER